MFDMPPPSANNYIGVEDVDDRAGQRSGQAVFIFEQRLLASNIALRRARDDARRIPGRAQALRMVPRHAGAGEPTSQRTPICRSSTYYPEARQATARAAGLWPHSRRRSHWGR